MARATAIKFTEDEVLRRLNAYQSPAITAEVLAMTLQLWQHSRELRASLDGKATTLLGFAGAMLAFLLTAGPQGRQPPVPHLAFLAGIAAAGAVVLGALALRARTREHMGEGSWFPEPKMLQSDEHLRRHYVQVLHSITQNLSGINDTKGRCLVIGQWSIAVGASSLFLALLLTALR